MPREFKLPDLGEGIAEAQIIRVLVKQGENIAEDQYLFEVETDKAAVEVPSPFAGVVTGVHIEEGQTINVGDVVITFDDGPGGGATKKAAAPAVKAAAQETSRSSGSTTAVMTAVAAPPTAPPSPRGSRGTAVPASPAVRRLAREKGIDLATVRGSGPGGRVVKADVEGHTAAAIAPAAGPTAPMRSAPETLPGEPGTDQWGPIRTESISQIRKTIARQMSLAAFTAVHVTHCDEVDITDLERMRRRLNEATDNNPKLTIMSFVIRATCLALRQHPVFNASFDADGGRIIYKDYINLGIAVDSQRGLIVPVIRNAHGLKLNGVADSLRSLADQIRTNRFTIEDLRGGTFTITNVGALGGTVSTPIINHPEVAILGVGRSRKMPVVRDDRITTALMLPINLSFDHRVTDGANAARFAGDIIRYLQAPELLLVEG